MLALLACSGEAFAELSYYPTWIDDSGIHYTPGNEVVMKDEAAAGWNSGARSSEVLLAADDGWIRYEVESYQSATRAFGFAITDPNYHYTSMAYSFRLANSTCYFQKGSVIVGTMAVTQGDVLEIVKNGTDIEYKVNGVIRVTTTPAQFSDMFLDLAFHTRWGYIGKLEVSFGNDYDSEWEEVIGIAKTATTLTKTAADGWGNAGASSDNVLKPNEAGWVSYTPPNTTGHIAFGFSDLDKDQHYSSIDYCMLVDASGMLKGYSNGSLLFAGSYAAGDVLTITRQDNEYIFTQNTTVLHTSNDYSREPMIADLAIYRNNTVLNQSDFRVSFDQEVYSYVEVTPLDYDQDGVFTAKSFGTDVTKKYFWSSEIASESDWNSAKLAMDSTILNVVDSISFEDLFFSTSSSKISSISEELVLATRDDNGNVFRVPVEMTYQVTNDTIYGMDFSEGVLQKTAAYSSSANANWRLDNGIESGVSVGKVEIQPINGLSNNFRIGLTLENSTPASAGNHIEFGFSVSNGSLKTIYNGVLGSYYGKVFGNEILRTEFTTDSVFYFKDEDLIRSESLPQGNVYQLDAFITNQDEVIQVKKIAFDNIKKPIRRGELRTVDWSCDRSQVGEAYIVLPLQNNFCLFTFQLFDELGQLVSSNPLGVFTNILPGNYTIKAIPSGDCDLSEWTYNFDIGYEVDWTDTQAWALATNTVEENSVLYNGSGLFYAGSNATSVNQLNYGIEGWIEVDVSTIGVFQLVDQNGDLFLSTYFNEQYGLSITLLFNEDGTYVALWDNDADGRIRLSREGGQYFARTSLNNTISVINNSFPRVNGKGHVDYGNSRLINCRASFSCPNPLIQYSPLQREISSNVYLAVDDVVYFSYDNDYFNPDGNFTLKVFDAANNDLQVSTTIANVDPSNPILSSTIGYNKYALDLNLAGISAPGDYIIQVTNDKGENYFLRFAK
ncbi:hypothetical protein [Sanyastnella coralliicola]|uniref:hypothetical protein n=1 Tax=Sanyastnella coralliicola TaxID=3069118 RepID=UPI0027B88E33|nr:hypothetical protein [Longitalea sp. SCSIO 12813]